MASTLATRTDLRSDRLADARAEALFASELSAMVDPTPEQVTAAIRRALLRHGGVRGCAAEVAAAYGDRPETAAPRMRWARGVVRSCYRGAGQGAHPTGHLNPAA
jgi:hypothetical protein